MNYELLKSLVLPILFLLISGILIRYGHCKAILNISYEREYYLLNDQRITLDKKIVYSSYKNNKKKFHEPLSIIEFKSDVNSEINSLNNIMPNSVSRFSKYCRGMNKVFFNIKDYT
jgi:hypothetical protein